jgi:hypothetical protein
MESGLPIAGPISTSGSVNQHFGRMGIPYRFRSLENRSSPVYAMSLAALAPHLIRFPWVTTSLPGSTWRRDIFRPPVQSWERRLGHVSSRYRADCQADRSRSMSLDNRSLSSL